MLEEYENNSQEQPQTADALLEEAQGMVVKGLKLLHRLSVQETLRGSDLKEVHGLLIKSYPMLHKAAALNNERVEQFVAFVTSKGMMAEKQPPRVVKKKTVKKEPPVTDPSPNGKPHSSVDSMPPATTSAPPAFPPPESKIPSGKTEDTAVPASETIIVPPAVKPAPPAVAEAAPVSPAQPTTPPAGQTPKVLSPEQTRRLQELRARLGK